MRVIQIVDKVRSLCRTIFTGVLGLGSGVCCSGKSIYGRHHLVHLKWMNRGIYIRVIHGPCCGTKFWLARATGHVGLRGRHWWKGAGVKRVRCADKSWVGMFLKGRVELLHGLGMVQVLLAHEVVAQTRKKDMRRRY